MDNFYVDIFSTKALEYLLVIMFLVSLVLYWRALHKPGRPGVPNSLPAPPIPRAGWFSLADGLYYHQGHSWVSPEGDDLARIGVDDFAQRLLGRPDAVHLPDVGTSLEQGGRGWMFHFGPDAIELLSPVGGTVVAVNNDILSLPGLINDDPYGRGWILKVRAPKLRMNLRNLLSGNLASSWMEETVTRLRQRISPQGAAVLQDGGVPTTGFARNVSPEHWTDLVREFLPSS
ncbi:MAG: glycine cleavage system protein H [Bacteroidota bacterium]